MNKSLLVLKIILVCLAFTPTVITYYPKLKAYMEPPEEIVGCFPLIPIGYKTIVVDSSNDGYHNVAIGYQALYVTRGMQNVVIGH